MDKNNQHRHSSTVTNGNGNHDNNCGNEPKLSKQQYIDKDNERITQPVECETTTIDGDQDQTLETVENEHFKIEMFDPSSPLLSMNRLDKIDNKKPTTPTETNFNKQEKNEASSSANTDLKKNSSNHTHHNPHQLVQQQTSLSSTATISATNLVKKSPKKTKGTPTYQRPPDGGWGWMVVLASFVINFIADGVSLSFGVIYVELVAYFNESKSKTAWVGSLFLSIPLITGPIASALVDQFGCRKVTIAGSLLAASGFFLGHFATCIEHLFITFSLAGFGLALCYVTSIVSVAYWFDKRRSMATGLAVCGTGFGTFIFAPFIIYLIREYNWRGTLLILSAVFLNMICCGFLIRDLNIDTSSVTSSSSSSSSSNSEDTSNLDSSMDSVDEADEIDLDPRPPAPNSPQMEERHRLLKIRPRMLSESDQALETFPRHTASLINIPTFIKHNNNNGIGDEMKGENHENPSKDQEQCHDIIGELTFRRGGYLHNLICYYPHLLAMFLPWDMQCDDLTVKTKFILQSSPNQQNDPNNGRISMPSPIKPVKASQKAVGFGSIHHMDSNLKLNGNNSLLPGKDEQEFKQSTRHSSTTSRFGQLLNFARQSNQSATAQQSANDQTRGNRLHNLRLPRGSLTYRSAMLVINKYRLKASSAPDIYRTSMVTINEEKGITFWHSFKEIFKSMVDLNNFKSSRYSIFCLSNFLLYACVDVPYVYIPDQVITSGASTKEGASTFISIIGVFNTFGVVIVGYIGDKPWMDVSFMYAILICIGGVSMATIPLTTQNFVIVIQTAIYGFCISANYSLVSVILVELISLDSFTTSYGMLLLIQGIGSLVGPPLAGWVYDLMQSYDAAFYITGLTMILSGILVIPVGDKKNCFLWKPPSEENTSVLGIASSDAGSSSPTSSVNKTKNDHTDDHTHHHRHDAKLNGQKTSKAVTEMGNQDKE